MIRSIYIFAFILEVIFTYAQKPKDSIPKPIIKTNYSQISIMPKLGFNLDGFNAVSKSQIKRNDLRIGNTSFGVGIGCDILLKNKKNYFFINIESTTLTSGFRIINDSGANYLNQPNVYTRSGLKHNFGVATFAIYLGMDRKVFFKKSKQFNGLLGLGIGFISNIHKEFAVIQPELYYQTYRWAIINNFSEFEVFTYRRGHGLGLKMKSTVIYLNEKKKEKVRLECYWNQGLIVMNNHIVNYGYGVINNPSTHRKINGYRFDNRGTSAGVNIGIPILLYKNKSKK